MSDDAADRMDDEGPECEHCRDRGVVSVCTVGCAFNCEHWVACVMCARGVRVR